MAPFVPFVRGATGVLARRGVKRVACSPHPHWPRSALPCLKSDLLPAFRLAPKPRVIHWISDQPCADRIPQHVVDLLIDLLLLSQSAIERFLLPDGSAASKFPIDFMRRGALDGLHDLGDAHGTITLAAGHKREVCVIWHDHDCEQVEQDAIAAKAGVEYDSAGAFRQRPSLVRTECDEKNLGVGLVMWQTSAVFVLVVHDYD